MLMPHHIVFICTVVYLLYSSVFVTKVTKGSKVAKLIEVTEITKVTKDIVISNSLSFANSITWEIIIKRETNKGDLLPPQEKLLIPHNTS